MSTKTKTKHRSRHAELRAQAMETGLLERDEEMSLARAWRDHGDRAARDRLVLAHQKLVVGMARRFERHNVPFDDLFSEGVVALMVAADKFDPDTGNRFATYAQWWVLTYLQEYVQRDICPVRIGRTRREKTIVRELARERRRQSLGIDDEARARIAGSAGVPVQDVHLVEAALASRALSLNHAMGEGEASEFIDQLADDSEGEVKMIGLHLEGAQARVVAELLEQLDDERQRYVIRERHLSDTPRTLRELAADLKLSSERVRQIEAEALQRLRRMLRRNGYRARDLIGAA